MEGEAVLRPHPSAALSLPTGLHCASALASEAGGLPPESGSSPPPLPQPGASLGMLSTPDWGRRSGDRSLAPRGLPSEQGKGPRFSLGALPIQEEVAVQAALTFVPIAVILAVHTHSLVFTRPLCHPVFNLTKETQRDHKKGRTVPFLPETRPGSPFLPPLGPASTSLAPSWPFRAPSWRRRRGCCHDRRRGRAGRSHPPQPSPRTGGGTARSGCPANQGWGVRGGDRLGVGQGHSENTRRAQQGLRHSVWAIPAFLQFGLLPSLARLP